MADLRKKIIIGLAGRIAAGKETAGKYLIEKYGAEKIRFSDPLRQTLDILDLPTNRENMQNLSTLLRQNFDENILAHALVKLSQKLNSDVIVIDGVRRQADIKNFKERENFYLIFIDTNPDLRYERYVQRNENPGDGEMTRENFNERDSAEAESQVEGLRSEANFIITNNGTLDELYQQIENVLKQIHEIKN